LPEFYDPGLVRSSTCGSIRSRAIDVSPHKLPDRGLVAVAGAVLRGQWRDSDGKADECEQCAHDNSSIE